MQTWLKKILANGYSQKRSSGSTNIKKMTKPLLYLTSGRNHPNIFLRQIIRASVRYKM